MDFFNSHAGRKFVEWTIPELVHQLKKLNEHLEKLMATKSIGDINRDIKSGMDELVKIKTIRETERLTNKKC